ncbi:OmpR family DNA-binding response regulator [Tetragenococcus muriaticus PMC-11-5]|uniref:OmpR family DNA-binding response regulator n=1 Tax=Tetragenococcus muriaticus PMC-11-5 TaxID=1302649 RepID=A0A091C8M8_9ENTE|nr:OmpR family DNA-binding response regulator [Tetragenococcus muriaticus PMC-11-5]
MSGQWMRILKTLRQKVEKIGPQVIQTVWGVGYKFDDSGDE